MKILAVADEESKSLWDFWDKSKLEGVELILSCGDLSADYLSFLTTMSGADVLYVHGNHDIGYSVNPPEGCICIDDSLFVYKGIRILGLGGSMQYSSGKFQYTEKQMKKRISHLKFRIFLNGGFDILLTHAPMYGINDMQDIPHRGFQCFTELINKYKPEYFIHGHVHKSYGEFCREQNYENTKIINAFEKYIFEYKNKPSP